MEPKEVKKTGRPKGSYKVTDPVELGRIELIEVLRLSKKIRELIDRQIVRLGKEAEGITGAGNIAKLMESLTRSLDVLIKDANAIIRQSEGLTKDEDTKPSVDGKALLKELLG